MSHRDPGLVVKSLDEMHARPRRGPLRNYILGGAAVLVVFAILSLANRPYFWRFLAGAAVAVAAALLLQRILPAYEPDE